MTAMVQGLHVHLNGADIPNFASIVLVVKPLLGTHDAMGQRNEGEWIEGPCLMASNLRGNEAEQHKLLVHVLREAFMQAKKGAVNERPN